MTGKSYALYTNSRKAKFPNHTGKTHKLVLDGKLLVEKRYAKMFEDQETGK